MAEPASSSLPPPKDFTHHLSSVAQNQRPSELKKFYKYFALPGIAQVAGGLPNDHFFSFDTLEARTAVPTRFKQTPNDPVEPGKPHSDLALDIQDKAPESARLFVPGRSGETNPLKEIDLKVALQYGQAFGIPPLLNFVKAFTTQYIHPNVPYAGGVDAILTSGSTDGFNKVFQTLFNDYVPSQHPYWMREGILVEEFAYTIAVQAMRPKCINVVPVTIDQQGMMAEGPGGLEWVLENWDKTRGKRPHAIYTVTLGHNPTSGVMSVSRMKKIYKICQKYDVMIIEDNPYWFLQYPSAKKANIASGKIEASAYEEDAGYEANSPRKSSGSEYLDSLVPSYISMDVDGRVVRLDTFSKMIAPGCRMGWVTGQPALIERILRLTEAFTMQPSGFVQSMVSELLIGPQNASDPGRGGMADGSGWQFDGWIRWLEGLRGTYERRMNVVCRVLEEGKYLVKSGRRTSLADEWSVVERTQLLDFAWPMAGMFLWLEILVRNHPVLDTPEAQHLGIREPQLSQALWYMLTTAPYRVLLGPADLFSVTDVIREEKAWRYFRICFASSDEDELEAIMQRLVDGIAHFWRIKDPKAIKKLLEAKEEMDRDLPDAPDPPDDEEPGKRVARLTGFGC